MTTKEIKVSSLKKSLACQANKKFAFETKPGQLGEAVVRSRIVKDTIKNAPVINGVPTAKYGILETTNRESDYVAIDCSENIAVVTFDVDKAYFTKPVDILGEDDNYYYVVDENDNEDMVRRIKKTMSYFVEVD